jgi:hypothetical protein
MAEIPNKHGENKVVFNPDAEYNITGGNKSDAIKVNKITILQAQIAKKQVELDELTISSDPNNAADLETPTNILNLQKEIERLKQSASSLRETMVDYIDPADITEENMEVLPLGTSEIEHKRSVFETLYRPSDEINTEPNK